MLERLSNIQRESSLSGNNPPERSILKPKGLRLFCVAVMGLLLTLTLSSVAAAQEPERSITLSATYTSVTVEKDQTVTLPVQIRNKSKSGELVDIALESAPPGWDAKLADSEYGKPLGVRGMYLLPYEPSPDMEPPTIYLKAQVPSTADPADYIFVIKVTTQDKKIESSLTLNIGVVSKVTAGGGAAMIATYPVLSGPSGNTLKFKVDLVNQGGEARSFDLSANLPSNWDVGFYPAWESTRVSTIRLDAGYSRSIDVSVTPPQSVTPGEYPFTVTVTSSDAQVSVDLEAVVTGTYYFVIGTATGVANTEAIAGHETHFSFLALNYGSAELGAIDFFSTKPEGWRVTFNPSRLASMAAGELGEIEVIIEPAEGAASGDYIVGVRAASDRASATLDIRVTVGRSSSWGWIGLGTVLAVIVGMGGVFWRARRR